MADVINLPRTRSRTRKEAVRTWTPPKLAIALTAVKESLYAEVRAEVEEALRSEVRAEIATEAEAELSDLRSALEEARSDLDASEREVGDLQARAEEDENDEAELLREAVRLLTSSDTTCATWHIDCQRLVAGIRDRFSRYEWCDRELDDPRLPTIQSQIRKAVA